VHVPGRPPSLEPMEATLSRWAEGFARALLEQALPRRWAHVQGVAARARNLAPALGQDAGMLEAAAWLHDIGYLPELATTGLHGLDGARYLRDVQLPGVGVDPDQPGDLALDPGFLPGLRTAACTIDSPRSIAPPGTAQLSLSERRISKTSPAPLTTTTLTEGARLLAAGAAGSS
jgi:hypothetical protein